MIYVDDHGPAHVHVVGQGERAAFTLGCESGAIALRGATGLGAPDIAAISGFIAENRDILCQAWRKLHHDK